MSDSRSDASIQEHDSRVFMRSSPVTGWVQVLILTSLLLGLYAGVLKGLVDDWLNDPNYSHGFLVPVFSAYLIWDQRQKLRTLIAEGSWLGLPLLMFGLAILVLGQIGAELFTTRSSLIIVLAGLVLFHLGREFFKALLFPLLFLFFMIPLPAIIFNAIAFPLQQLAAQNAAWGLNLLGVPVLLDGNIIHLSHASLGVTEACSGIRSLVSLLALAVVWAYLSLRGIWPKLLLVASAVPVTILANSGRVVFTGLIAENFNIKYAEGFYHELAGMVIFVVAFAGLLGVSALIRLLQKSAGKIVRKQS